jgi:hypothetical protein
MKKTSGSSKLSFLYKLFNWLWHTKPQPPADQVPPDNPIEPARMVTSRVLLVIYDPVMDPLSGIRLSQLMQWQSPDELVNAFFQDVLEASGGMARYQVAQRVQLNEFPLKADGYRYDAATYLDVLKGIQQPHLPEEANYLSILTGLNILPRIAKRDFDEVLFFAFPHAGFFESTMGGAGAFWCNSNPLVWSSNCPRRFVVMGYSYERGPGEMLESFGHRAESLVAKVFNCQDFVSWAYTPRRVPAFVSNPLNLFQRFISFDQIAPGKAGVGTIHYAPNSDRDYDWNNPGRIPSSCFDWYNFPKFKNDIRLVNASEWGEGDIRAHHKWWLKHLPKVAGRTEGVSNNWWQYVMDPNLISV